MQCGQQQFAITVREVDVDQMVIVIGVDLIPESAKQYLTEEDVSFFNGIRTS